MHIISITIKREDFGTDGAATSLLCLYTLGYLLLLSSSQRETNDFCYHSVFVIELVCVGYTHTTAQYHCFDLDFTIIYIHNYTE